MTTRQGRNLPVILEWALVGLAALWFLGVPPLVAAVSVLGLDVPAEGTGQITMILLAGGLQIGGLLAAMALAKLISRRDQLFRISLALLLAAGCLTLTGLTQLYLPGGPSQALIGILYLLGVGGWALGWIFRCNLPRAWVKMGLTRSGSLGWGLAAAALVLWPWLLVGSLGDMHASATLLFQSLVGGLLAEWLWRGLVLSLLLSVTRRRWLAGLLGALLYVAYEIGALALGSGELGTWQVATIFALAFLTTELWARSGKEREGVWGAVAFHVLYLAFPRLFVDPRLEFELAHLATQLYMPLATGAIAVFLFLGRKIWPLVIRWSKAPTSTTGKKPSISQLLPAVLALTLWSALLGVYLIFGSPGFSNDGYLIILKEQADLGLVADIPTREGKLVFLYTLLAETAAGSQEEIRADLDEMNLTYRPYYLVNMIRVDGTQRGMDEFAARPDVAQVMLNPNVREYPVRWKIPYAGPADEAQDTPWGVDRIDAELVWELGITGEGIVVAGQDSGYDWEHPALQDSYRGWDGQNVDHDRNWHDAWDDRPDAFDDDTHGTHTLGTAVGNEVGVAPDARWIGCRNMRHGLGNPGSYVECMEFFLAPYPAGGDPFHDGDPLLAPHVVNNSWGCPPMEGCVGPEPIRTAVEVLRAAGIMMVVSAGNDGPACSTVWVPASEDAVFSVGASDREDSVVDFSSRGPTPEGLIKPDVLAPGVEIRSSVPDGAYAGAGGTSMAGPHVAGLVALLWSANPDLIGDIDRTEQIIIETAQVAYPRPGEVCSLDQPGQAPNNVYGYGIVDALAAVEAALAMNHEQ